MENEKKIQLLQLFYTGVLVDSVLRFGREGILDKVTMQKRQEQLMTGKVRAEQLGINKPEEVFQDLVEIFGCANWQVEQTQRGFVATASKCMLCGMAKKYGTECPCHIYCLDAMEGMIKGIAKQAEYNVVSTLWNESECRVEVEYR